MLGNKKMGFFGDSVVNGNKIASFSATLDLDTMELNMSSRHIDKELCKIYRDNVRADQAEFENFAYSIQDMLKPGNE